MVTNTSCTLVNLMGIYPGGLVDLREPSNLPVHVPLVPNDIDLA